MTATKCLLFFVLLLSVADAAGIAGCKIMGRNAHKKSMLAADLIGLVAAAVAVAPAQRRRGRLDTAGMFQAALIGTVLHLGMVLIAGIVLLMLKRGTTPFILWLLAAYWMTLIGLCVAFAKLIQTAPKPAKAGT